jgi:hypothetical protein
MVVRHRAAGNARAFDGGPQHFRNRDQADAVAQMARGLGGRKQKLDRGNVGLVDAGAIELELLLIRQRLADQIVDDANTADAAVRRKAKLLRFRLNFHVSMLELVDVDETHLARRLDNW